MRDPRASYPVDVRVEPAIGGRNRPTTFFRALLAIPHLLLVGGPLGAIFAWWAFTPDDHPIYQRAPSGGAIGLAAMVAAIIAWFTIVITGRCPDGLRKFPAYYLRWRVRAVAYMALLRDEYPPFGEGSYPASLELTVAPAERDRLAVAFRIILALPHLIVLWPLAIAAAISSIVAWFAILFTGRYPEVLYRFGVGVFRWSTRVEAYLLLLCDAYPPFTLS